MRILNWAGRMKEEAKQREPPNSAPSRLADGYKRRSILTANIWLLSADFAKNLKRERPEEKNSLSLAGKMVGG